MASSGNELCYLLASCVFLMFSENFGFVSDYFIYQHAFLWILAAAGFSKW